MKRVPGTRTLRVLHLMVILIALHFLSSSTSEFILIGQSALANVKTVSPLLAPLPQRRTIEIDIADRLYVPPAKTPKIPPGLKEKGVRFAVRAGDTIKICNRDTVFAKPFSFSKGNRFEGLEGSGGLPPGRCTSYVVQNEGKDAIRFDLFNAIHPDTRLFLVVLPANAPDEGEEDTPPPPRTRTEPLVMFPTDGGVVIEDETQSGATKEQLVKWSGTYVNAAGTSTIIVTGDRGRLTAEENWKVGDRYGRNAWVGCTVQANTAKCKWTGTYEGDPAKSGTRSGTLTVTLDGNTLTGRYDEDTPNFKRPDGKPFDSSYSSIHKGAEWPVDFKRQ